MGDIVDTLGAQFNLPIPFLWQHDATQPLGHVTFAKPTKDGIPVKIEIPDVKESGPLRDRLMNAMQSMKYGLVKGLSIGFSPVEYNYMEDTGGYRFVKWNWYELSAVTIPANMEANIAAIKSLDMKRLAKAAKRPVVKVAKLSRPAKKIQRKSLSEIEHVADFLDNIGEVGK
jgi:HK97 family phage prohead protease